jgi:hypothetical protein
MLDLVGFAFGSLFLSLCDPDFLEVDISVPKVYQCVIHKIITLTQRSMCRCPHRQSAQLHSLLGVQMSDQRSRIRAMLDTY